MNIIEVTEREPEFVQELLEVWESAVRATHLFLSDDEIGEIRQYVPQALAEIPQLIIARNEDGKTVGFMGIAKQRLEMLFISNENRGKSIGKLLLNHGIEKYGVNEVTVNEQNPQARGFYEHMGFETYKRTDLDEQGNPYPLLYMKRDR